jgi:hypothetical protein
LVRIWHILSSLLLNNPCIIYDIRGEPCIVSGLEKFVMEISTINSTN